MDVLQARCAGLDVHRDSVVACARLVTAEGTAYEIATFGTMAADLERLASWLSARGVTQVAMEASGVYWKPVWAALAAQVELILANAAHVKNVPGRKTDVNDATWLADLLAHGLIRASFVPGQAVQALRDLTRTRKQLTREKVAHAQRIDKLLQAANLRLGTVLSDILGASGRAILAALAAGETDPERLADRIQTRIRASRQQVIEALRGRLAEHQRQLLQIHLDQIDAIDRALGALDAALDQSLAPFQEAAGRLTTIPGVGALAAAGIIAEIGCDMSRFATPAHLISWAGLCPANDESAGKRRSTRLRKGAPWLKTLLVQVAWSAARAKAGYLPALFARLRARRGPKKAIIAVAAAILTAVYWMLRRGTSYQDLGTDYFERTDRQRLATKLVRKLDQLGFTVTLAQRQTTWLWGARASDWANIQEWMVRPVYEAVLERTRVTSGTRYLDVGCGAGMAAQIAAARGAQVSGIDAADALLDIARRRTPEGDFRQGDLEELPFDDQSFEVVTGFNSFQFTGNPVVALGAAQRVTKPGGAVVIVTWGNPHGMEAASLVAAMRPLMPPPRPGAPGPFALSDESALRKFAADAGLKPGEVFDVDSPFIYADEATAVRGLNSSGVAARAMENTSEQAVTEAHAKAIAPFRQPDGSYRIKATFRCLLA